MPFKCIILVESFETVSKIIHSSTTRIFLIVGAYTDYYIISFCAFGKDASY